MESTTQYTSDPQHGFTRSGAHPRSGRRDRRDYGDPMDSTLPERRSARLLIVEPGRRLLLFRYHDEHKDPFWATPGGELVEDETFEDAAARELMEETGQQLPIGEVVRDQTDVYAVARSGPARWHERYFMVRAPAAFAPSRRGWTEEEQDTIIDHRWWTAQALARASSSLKPRWLDRVLGELPM